MAIEIGSGAGPGGDLDLTICSESRETRGAASKSPGGDLDLAICSESRETRGAASKSGRTIGTIALEDPSPDIGGLDT